MLFSVRWTTSKLRGGVGGCVAAATPVEGATGDEAGVDDSDDAADVDGLAVDGVDVDGVTVPVTAGLVDAGLVGGGVGAGGVGVEGVGVEGVGVEGAGVEQALVDPLPVVFAERFPAASTASTAME
jgi:hypothetical protein